MGGGNKENRRDPKMQKIINLPNKQILKQFL